MDDEVYVWFIKRLCKIILEAIEFVSNSEHLVSRGVHLCDKTKA